MTETTAQERYEFRFVVKFGSWQRVQLEKSGPSEPSDDQANEMLGLTWTGQDQKIEMHWAEAKDEVDPTLRTLVVRGGPYADLGLAQVEARLWRARLQAAMARITTPGLFGDRTTQKIQSNSGSDGALKVELWNERLSGGGPILAVENNAVLYATNAIPTFVPFLAIAGTANDKFVETLCAITNANLPGLNEPQQRAFDLYAAAYIIDHPEARFLLLMAAMESLTHETMRATIAQTHLDHLIYLTKANNKINALDRDRLVGALSMLKRESGRTLLKSLAARLEPRRYDGLTPVKFVNRCYQLRTRIIHGLAVAESANRPSPQDIYWEALNLGSLLGDMLCLDFIEQVPDPHPRL